MKRNGAAICNGLQYNRSSTINKPPPAQFQCENWNVYQVIEWLRGFFYYFFYIFLGVLDNSTQYIRLFKKAGVDGPKLLCLEDSTLRHIGIIKEIIRKKILQNVNLLSAYV